jgi:hypothetical protein
MAVGLLRPCDKFNLSDFKTAWQGSVPEGKPYLSDFMWHKLKHIYELLQNMLYDFPGMTTNLKQLEGTVLVDLSSHPQTICYFNEQELPDNIMDRMQYLFEVRGKWTFNEIQPFVE